MRLVHGSATTRPAQRPALRFDNCADWQTVVYIGRGSVSAWSDDSARDSTLALAHTQYCG